MGPSNVLVWDPCSLDLPEILTVAHVEVSGFVRFVCASAARVDTDDPAYRIPARVPMVPALSPNSERCQE